MSDAAKTLQRHNRPRSAGAKQKQIEEDRVLDMVVAGWTHREIAAELGCSVRTVANRQDTALARKVPVTVAKYRDVMNEQLDHLFRLNIATAESDPSALERSIERAVKILDRKAKLNGVDAPIMVEATVTEVTSQERQLADLLAQAERDQKMREEAMTES